MEARDQDDGKRLVAERSLHISWRTSPVVAAAVVAVVAAVVAAGDIVLYSAGPD
jgi:hypothetical protein